MQRFLILAWTYICFAPNFVASRWLDAVQRSVNVNAGDLCFLLGERTTILNDRLYFQGGLFTFANGDISAQEKQLYWLDLKTSFPVDTIIPGSALRSISAQGSQAQLGGAFFTDALLTTMYGFAASNSTVALDSVESFNITTQQWANQSVSGGSFNGIGRGGSAFATTSTSGLGLGFYITNGLNAIGPSGLITFDASNPSALTWTWKTEGAPNVDVTALEYARYGNKGVLIAFGGYRDLFGAAELYDMSEIFIYDIDSQTWFNVTADGDVPGPRSEFCSTISAASDDSGFFITIYGGYNIHSGRAYEEVYVLEVPRFSWINMTSIATDNIELNLSPTAGRYGHHCELYGERQMIVLGGNIITQGGSVIVNSQTCNTTYPSIRLLDISTFQWQGQFTPGSSPYTIPPSVAQDVGGGPQGQVKNVSPTGGFNNTALTKIFNKTIPRIAVSSKSASSATNSTNGQNPLSTPSGPVPSPSSSTPIGAIVGGVVGGVLAIAIVGVLLYFFCYRRRRRSQQQLSEMDGAMGRVGRPETSSRNGVHEMHADNRSHEIDSNGIVEVPAAHALTKSSYHEKPSDNER